MKQELEKIANEIENAELASNVRDLDRASAIWWLKASADNLDSAIYRIIAFGKIKI